MDLQLEKHGAEMAVRLEGEFTIYSIAELKTSLSVLLEEETYIDIDLSAVVECDSAGVQLMVALKRESVRRGKMLTFTNPSAAVLEVYDLYNLAEMLSSPEPGADAR